MHSSGLSRLVVFNSLYKTMVSISRVYASVPPGLTLGICIFFLPWIANSREWGLLSCQIPWGGDEKTRQMPCPPSTLLLSGSYKSLQGVSRSHKGLQGITGNYKGIQGVTRGLQGVTEGYRRLQGVTGGYKGLQGVTRGYKGIKGIERE